MRRSRIPPLAKLALLIGCLAALYGGVFLGQFYRLWSYDLQALAPFDPPRPLGDLVWRGPDGEVVKAPLNGRWTLLFVSRDPGDWQGALTAGTRVRNRLAGEPTLQREMRVLLFDLDASTHAPSGTPPRFSGAVFEAHADPDAFSDRIDTPTAEGAYLVNPEGRALGRFTLGAEPATIAADILHLRAVHDQEPP